jgi:hypothetical protein
MTGFLNLSQQTNFEPIINDPEVRSESIYSKIPNAHEIDRELGSEQTGYLFSPRVHA